MIDLPSLHYYGEKEKASEPLKGCVLILIQHLLSDVKFFLKALEVVREDREQKPIISVNILSKDEVKS